MAKADAAFIYVGTYGSEAAARADYEVVKDLHAAGAVGTYDAGVVTKDADGKVHFNKHETATRHGGLGWRRGRGRRRHFVPVRSHRCRGGRGGGWRDEWTPVEGDVPVRCEGVQRPHRCWPGRPSDRGREHHGGRDQQGRIKGREACGQGARRQRQGPRQGCSGDGEGSQLRCSTYDAKGVRCRTQGSAPPTELSGPLGISGRTAQIGPGHQSRYGVQQSPPIHRTEGRER